MKKHLIAALMSVAVVAPTMMPTAATAQRYDDRRDNNDRRFNNDRRGNDRNWRGDDRNWDPSRSYQNGNYRERRLSRNDRIYRGKDGRAYCKRNDGTTGLVIGALGGGALANLIGGGTLGTLAGAGGGNVKCR
jgi:hypothetical protein